MFKRFSTNLRGGDFLYYPSLSPNNKLIGLPQVQTGLYIYHCI